MKQTVNSVVVCDSQMFTKLSNMCTSVWHA